LSNYNELDNGALLFGTEGTSVLFDMAKLREAIQFDKSSQKIIRNTSREVVWTGVAEMVKAATKATPVRLANLESIRMLISVVV